MSLRSLLRAAATSTTTVLRNPALRRIQFALAATALTTPAYAVALSVYAYREGGLPTVALVGVVTFLPSGLLAPVLSVLSDWGRRERVLAAALLLRGVTLAGSSVCVFVDAPPATVFALAALSSIASRVVFPTQAALVPSLARDDDELAATNALAATIDNVGAIVGPALAGALLLVSGPEPVIAITAVAALGAALLAGGLPASEPVAERARRPRVRDFAAGFVTVAGESTLRLPVALLVLQAAAFGTVGVLMVELAIELLALGEAGLGLLEIALGVGGIAGGALALGAASSRRLGACLALGAAGWGAAVALVGLDPQTISALALFTVTGVANVFVDVPAYTLIQRETSPAVLGRVFGALEGLGVLGTVAGVAVAPLLVGAVGVEGAFLVTGAFVLGVALVSWRGLRRLDGEASAVLGSELVEQPQLV